MGKNYENKKMYLVLEDGDSAYWTAYETLDDLDANVDVYEATLKYIGITEVKTTLKKGKK